MCILPHHENHQKAYMHSELTGLMQHAHIHFADIPESMSKHYDEERTKILVKDLKLTDIDRAILMTLLKIGKANVYKLSKTQNFGHYSTVLRSLRRLRKWNLVRVLPEGNSSRGEKVFTLTLFGEYIAVLSKGGWKDVVQKIGETSRKFQECVEVHQPMDKYHYMYIVWSFLKGLMISPRFTSIQPDIEKMVVEAEYVWIMETVLESLHSHVERDEAIKTLKKLSHIDWIRSCIYSMIDEETAHESDWLNVLARFRKDLKSAEKNTKLTQFMKALGQNKEK